MRGIVIAEGDVLVLCIRKFSSYSVDVSVE